MQAIGHSVEYFLSIVSGYNELTERRGPEEWEVPGENPYYLCAEFCNGRYIPAVLLETPPQGMLWMAIKVAALLRPSSLRQALVDIRSLRDACLRCGQELTFFEEEEMRIPESCPSCLSTEKTGLPVRFKSYQCPRQHYSHTVECLRCHAVEPGTRTWHSGPCNSKCTR